MNAKLNLLCPITEKNSDQLWTELEEKLGQRLDVGAVAVFIIGKWGTVPKFEN